jgi:hypothetical protein
MNLERSCDMRKVQPKLQLNHNYVKLENEILTIIKIADVVAFSISNHRYAGLERICSSSFE